ncbi:MAG: hypothetical protein J5654_11250 [Victivallales bacterium]|nr:hypothetical protein [Victivallales bacterium]
MPINLKDPVEVRCYGEWKKYPTRFAAIHEFRTGMHFCDPESAEYARYDAIVQRLVAGEARVADDL